MGETERPGETQRSAGSHQLYCLDMSLHIEARNYWVLRQKTEMADKHCGVESLKNSILDISESLKLFKSMEIAMKYFIFRFFHDFHL